MKDKYTPRQDCKCHSYSESECACDVDWTPSEFYELREQVKHLQSKIEGMGDSGPFPPLQEGHSSAFHAASCSSLPPVLDACCSTRMFWFDKKDTRALYVDKREGTRIIDVGTPGTIGRTPKTVAPDMIVDFRNMPFHDESFWHVVFDPPHFHKGAGATGRIAFDFGLLDATWRDDLRAGFAECFRVLKVNGTMIFKWCEAEIPLREVLALTPERPLYGHRSGKKAQTHWVAFHKTNAYRC